MRLIKYLKVNLNITNNEAKELLSSERITVNYSSSLPLYQVKNNDIVMLDGKIIKPIEKKYFLYYKPRGILSDISQRDDSYVNHINISYKLNVCGRLDKDSEGLMILSNDGEYQNRLLDPKSHVEKEYLISTKNIITNDFIERISNIKELEGKPLKPYKVFKYNNTSFKIVLSEGKYHQIRKMVILASNKVIELKRIRIDKYTIDDMKPGDIKEIKPL